MNNRRKLIVALGASALSSPFTIHAQPQKKVWRLGYLDFGTRQSMVDAGRYAALVEGLQERGYVLGKNLILETRFADGYANRLGELAAELVQQKVNLILATGPVATHAAMRAAPAIPIVVTVTSDPVREGFAANLARPGGNITGMSSGVEDTILKLVELLLIVAPKLKRIAVLTNPSNTGHLPLLARVQAAAIKAGRQVVTVNMSMPDDIERGFASMARERVDAMIIFIDAFLIQQRAQIASRALQQRLPSIFPYAVYPEAGGLMSYGADLTESFRRSGIFVDKILKGAKPGDIPFEQPTRYNLVINRKTANALGIKITGELLTRADKVIE